MKTIDHSLLLGLHIAVPCLTVTGRQPALMLAAVNIKPVHQLGVAEPDVHGALLVQGHVKELAWNVPGLPLLTSGKEHAVQVDRGGHIAVQVVKNFLNI